MFVTVAVHDSPSEATARFFIHYAPLTFVFLTHFSHSTLHALTYYTLTHSLTLPSFTPLRIFSTTL